MRCVTLLALCSLVGCAPQPRPDPVILTDVAAPLECPEPEQRPVPPHLSAALEIEAPTLLPAGQGDYGLTRAGVETLIDGYRALREREALWRAWASPAPGPP